MKTAKELRDYMLSAKERDQLSGLLGKLYYQIYEKSQLQFILRYEGGAKLSLYEREGGDGFTVGTYDAVKKSICIRSAIWKWDETPRDLVKKYPGGEYIREIAQFIEEYEIKQ